MKFAYSAKNQDGQVVNGLLEASTQEAAASLLQQSNLVVLKLEKREDEAWYSKVANSLFNRVNLKDLSVFTRQLATLLSAQVSIVESLQTIYNQTPNPLLKEAVFDIYSDIQAGLNISEALSRHSYVFSAFYVNMIKASEFTGRLDEALLYLADYYESQESINKKIKNAMIYPIFVIVLFMVVVVIMVTVVVPQLGSVILESGVSMEELPIMTRILFSLGDFFQQYYLLVLLFILGGIFVVVKYFASEEGQMFLATIFLNFPVIGGFFRNLYIARFTETFSVLLRGAIPVAQALEISGDVIGSVYYQQIIYEVAEGVRQGEPISDMLSRHPDYFPALVSQMVAVGEKTGRLEELLKRVAQYYSRELEGLVNSLTEIIQPVLIVLLGVLIGGLIAAVILPIYQIAQKF